MGSFRKEVYEHIEQSQIERVIFKIVKPPARFTRYAFFVLMVLFVFWLFEGTITRRIVGEGMILYADGQIYDAVSSREGMIVDMLVKPGAAVKKDQVLVRLERPELKKTIASLKQQIRVINDDILTLRRQFRREQKVLQQYTRQMNDSLNRVIKLQIEHLDNLKESLPKRKEQVLAGVISQLMIEEQVRLYYQQLSSVNDNVTQLIQVKQQEIELESKWEQSLIEANEKLLEKRLELVKQTYEYNLATTIVSPVSGMVVAVKATPGSYIESSTSVVSLITHDSNLEVKLLIPAERGTMVRKTMHALIEPAGYDIHTYGAIKATVDSINPYPVSRESLNALFQNELLISGLVESNKNLLLVTLKLDKDPRSDDGYAWTTQRVMRRPVNSGSLCKGQIIVEKRRPLSYIIPTLKQLSGAV